MNDPTQNAQDSELARSLTDPIVPHMHDARARQEVLAMIKER